MKSTVWQKEAGEEGQADEIRAQVEERMQKIEAESDIVILPLKKLVAVQTGSGLLALQAQMGRS